MRNNGIQLLPAHQAPLRSTLNYNHAMQRASRSVYPLGNVALGARHRGPSGSDKSRLEVVAVWIKVVIEHLADAKLRERMPGGGWKSTTL
jgi:hypothetical protein